MRHKSKAGKKFLRNAEKVLRNPMRNSNLNLNANIEEEEEVHLSEDDFDIIKEYGSSLSFLSNLTEENLKKKTENLQLPLKQTKPVIETNIFGQENTDEEDELPNLTDSQSDDETSEESNNSTNNLKRKLDSNLKSFSEDSESEFEKLDTIVSDADTEEELEDVDFEKHTYLPSKKKRKQNVESDEEIDVEAMAIKKDKWTKKVNSRLPIIDDEGNVLKVNQPLIVDRVEGDELIYIKEKEKKNLKQKQERLKKKFGKDFKIEDEETEKSEDEKMKVDLKNPVIQDNLKNLSNLEKQERLAEIASIISSDPEKNINLLKTLREFTKDNSNTIKKFAYITQLAVYKDIIPGYRIRQLSAKESTIAVSKEVKILRQYEESLLSNYQAYLQSIDKCIAENTKKNSKKENYKVDESLLIVAVRCLTELLQSVSHFNFRINILMAIVDRMSLKTPPEVSILCCNSISNLFDNDITGESSLEAVKLISKMLKQKNFNVTDEVLKTFLHLRLQSELHVEKNTEAEKQDKKTKNKNFNKKKKSPHISNSIRKVMKDYKEIEDEMKEAEAVVNKDEKKKLHLETLKLVFVTYFRILKHAKFSPLLPAVLEGLARFAHLISVDFFEDLLNVLKSISKQQLDDYLSNEVVVAKDKTFYDARSAFHSIVASFQLLSGQGESLNIDLKDFCEALYVQLLRLPCIAGESIIQKKNVEDNNELEYKKIKNRKSALDLAIQGMELIFLKRKEVSADRICAFKYPKLKNLLDVDETLGRGVFRPDLKNPELCNPFSTSLWELSLLMNHYDPVVKKLATNISNGKFTKF
ncbi:Nucleolar complex protein 3 [Lobulomyces angularis]|nr:Nucleolar complex protein 3 [Lobulomyces angularis]